VPWQTAALWSNGAYYFQFPGEPNQSVGSHTVTIKYLGNGTYPPASNTQSFTIVSPGTTQAGLTAILSSNSFTTQDVVRVTVQLACNSACGTIEILEDGVSWVTAPLWSGGGYIFQFSSEPNQSLGTHTITVRYFGSATYAAASNTQSFTIVNPGTTPAGLTATMSLNSFTTQDVVTLAVQLACNSACGSVEILEDGVPWQTVALWPDGGYILPFSGEPNQSLGTHTITVKYFGSATYAAASSTQNFTIVNPGTAPTTVVATMTSQSFTAQDNVDIYVQVGCNAACGSVELLEDGVPWFAGAIFPNGSYAAPFSGEPNSSPGPHTISIQYFGSATYAPATSNIVNFTITP
jgi:hypothetical protein